MTDSKLLDSSIWIAYFFENKFLELIEKEGNLLLCALSIFEIKRKLLRKKIPDSTISNKLNFIREKSLIITPSAETFEEAAGISIKNKMPMADSIIYASTLENDAVVYTLDNHFRKLKNAKVLD